MTIQSTWEHAYAKWRKTLVVTPRAIPLSHVGETPAVGRPMEIVAAWLQTLSAPAPSSEIADTLDLAPKAVGCALGILSRKGQAKKLPQGWVAVRRTRRA